MTVSFVVEQMLSNSYSNFLKGFHNKVTRQNYESRLKKYFNYCQVENHDQLLYNGDIKLIQTRVTDFLIHEQASDLSSSIVTHYLSAIKLFYTMNDITNINWKKISRVLKPYRKESNDRPYTPEEISKMLECVDIRGRVVILLMCSSGMRMGAIHSIKIAHLERMGEIYKIIVYHNDPEEYTTSCSVECAKSIDDYLEYRKRCGEIIKPSGPLIREQFDKDGQEQAASPR